MNKQEFQKIEDAKRSLEAVRSVETSAVHPGWLTSQPARAERPTIVMTAGSSRPKLPSETQIERVKFEDDWYPDDDTCREID